MYKDLALITNSNEIAQTSNFETVDLLENSRLFVKGYGYVQEITVSTPSAGTFTAAVTDICTKSAHGFQTGLKVRVSTTTTLPAPLLAATDYFVIRIDANTFYLAASLNDANAGTDIDITTTGTGTHTITPTALAGANYQKQVSVDGVTWINSGSATNITVSTNVLTEKLHPLYNYVRNVYTLTAGQLSIVEKILLKGN